MAINSFEKTMEKQYLTWNVSWRSYFLIFCETGGAVYTVYWEGKGLRIFFFYVPGCHGECFKENRKCDIWWDFFLFFSPNASAKKGQPAMSQCGKLTVMRREWDTDGGREGTGSCTVPSYVNIYTLHWGVSPKAISWKMDFVYYCTVQDSALNVLWLL